MEDHQPKQVIEKKSKHKRNAWHEEGRAQLNGSVVTSRSYKVYPDDTPRETLASEFYNIKGLKNNEGPTDDL
jgi:hypothetical protein